MVGGQRADRRDPFDGRSHRDCGRHGAEAEDSETLQAELKVLLAETAAWRAYYQRLNLEEVRAVAQRYQSR